MGSEAEERLLENQLELQLHEQRDSLTALNDAIASDPTNSELLAVYEELVQGSKDAEEGLLHLKRARLLREADSALHVSGHTYVDVKPEPLGSALHVSGHTDEDVKPEPLEKHNYSVGSKCRFRHTNGRWYNGQIVGLDNSNFAKISFLTPTSENMLICKFFLQQRCRFGNNCRLSHGRVDVPLHSLKNYIPTIWEQSLVGSSIWAVSDSKGGIWREAELESWDDMLGAGNVVFRDDGTSAKLGEEAITVSEYAEISDEEESDAEIGRKPFPVVNLTKTISEIHSMKIAVEGCMHGDLDNVYKTLQYYERVHSTKIDLLLCCGDFQSVRNEKDLESLNVPPKYRAMNSFWKYYSGEEVAPYPTIFISGNHEASNYLWELYYGGWAAPNIYFLGFAGVIKFGNLRIGGLSGIYNARHYHSGHYERPPYNESTIRSVYHVCEYDVQKLMQVEEPIDIFLSHDWPLGITDCGDWKKLVRFKPFFEKEIQERTLGSKPASKLLEKLKPPYWFAAHLHCKFSALVQHGEDGPVTNFLALDKCLPGRKFLQIIEIESELGPYEIQYDEEWLAITRRFNSIFPLTTRSANFGNVNLEMQDCRQWVKSRLQTRGAKPFEFTQTVPCHNPSKSVSSGSSDGYLRNPQTESFLQFLELPYLLDNKSESSEVLSSPISLINRGSFNDNSEDIPIDDVDELEELAEDDAETEDAQV